MGDARLLVRYLGVVAVHKWAIVVAGRDVNRAIAPSGLRVSWRRLLLHDLSKLTRAELMPYARHFGTPHRGAPDPAFAAAWRHHYEHNDHHPEHFVQPDGTPARMPDEAVVEMVVDWMAAGRAYAGAWPCCGGHWRWLEDSWDQLRLHPDNKRLAGAIVHALGYAIAIPDYDWDRAIAAAGPAGSKLAALRGVARSNPVPVR